MRPITALEALDACEEALAVYAGRVYVAEDEGGEIRLYLSMLSQDKDTRVVRVPVGYRLMLTGSRNGDRRTEIANHGVVVPAAAAAPASTGVALPWRCNMVTNTTAYRPTIAE